MSEFLQGFFVNIGNDDVRVIVWLEFHDNTVLVAGGIPDFSIHFEKLVVENVFCRFRSKVVFGISKDQDEEYGNSRKRDPEKKFFLNF